MNKLHIIAIAIVVALMMVGIYLINDMGEEQGIGMAAAQTSTSLAPPNIVILIADDLGWNDLGVYGNRSVHTPNIDKLAASGLRFDNAFLTTSSCSASRASILTGKYPHSNGLVHLPQSLSTEETDSSTERWIERLRQRPAGKPFFFWLASRDPHPPHRPTEDSVPYEYDLDSLDIPAGLMDGPGTAATLSDPDSKIRDYIYASATGTGKITTSGLSDRSPITGLLMRSVPTLWKPCEPLCNSGGRGRETSTMYPMILPQVRKVSSSSRRRLI